MQNISLAPAVPKPRKSAHLDRADRLSRLFAAGGSPQRATIEVLIGMALVLAGSYALQPQDPLLLSAPFPWIWLVATIFALRYGAILGAVAGLCIVLGWFILYRFHADAVFPSVLFAGGMVQLILAGHFCDLWRARLSRLDAVNDYLDDRLSALTNQHYLLKASHERLEQDILARPFTLRAALEHLRMLPVVRGEVLPHAPAVLSLAANGCQMSQAAIFAVSDTGIETNPAAVVGAPFELDHNDVLVRDCLELGALRHVRQSTSHQGNYLVCAPIRTSSGELLGLLVVRQMSFLALSIENMELLLVLLNYYADGIDQARLIAPVLTSVPRCPPDFALELARAARMGAQSGVSSTLVAMVVPDDADGSAVKDHIMRQRRAFDQIWAYDLSAITVMIALFPLTDDAGAEGYFARLDHDFHAASGRSLYDSGLVSSSVPVDIDEPGFGLTRLVAWSNRHA